MSVSLGILSDSELFTVYSKALSYKLEMSFVELLLEELNRRGLDAAS